MLVGRGPEIARIARLLDAARERSSGALVVRGPVGIGKSALLRRAVDKAEWMRVLSTCAIESEAVLPFAGLSDLVRPILDRLDALPPSQRGAMRGALALERVESGDRFAACAATLGLLCATAEERPVLAVIDDAQWLDEESALALVFAARRMGPDPVAMLFGARDEDNGAGFAAAGLDELRVTGLDDDAAFAVIAAAAHVAPAPEVAAQLTSATGGNPLALIELTHALSDRQLNGEAPLDEPLTVSGSIERALAHRLDGLDIQARRALLVAAAATDADAEAILPAVGTAGSTAAALQRAEAAGFVEIGDGRITFTHPLVRSAVYGTASAHDRRLAHRALADAAKGTVSGERRAWHRAAAAVGSDESVASGLERAARDAVRRGGYATAAVTLERAARLTPGDDGVARRLLLAADCARRGGRAEHALALVSDGLRRASAPRMRALMQRARGRVDLWRGEARSAHELLVAEAARIEPADRRLAAEMLTDAAAAAVLAGDAPEARSAGLRARDLMSGERDFLALFNDLIVGTALHCTGEPGRGVALLSSAIDHAGLLAAARPEPEYAIYVAGVLVWLGEHDAARRLLTTTIAEARTAAALGVLSCALWTLSDRDS